MKHPKCPVMIAKPMPVTKALKRKSSNIINLNWNDQCSHLEGDHDHVDVDRVQEWGQFFDQKA